MIQAAALAAATAGFEKRFTRCQQRFKAELIQPCQQAAGGALTVFAMTPLLR